MSGRWPAVSGRWRLLGVAGALAVLLTLLATAAVGPALERELGLALLFRLRGPRPPPPGVVIIAQDYASARRLGLRDTLAAWPRRHLATVVRNATAAGARAIAIDLILETAREPADDLALAAALRASGRVVLFERMRQGPAEQSPAVVVESAIPPLPMLEAAAAALAPFPLPRQGSRVSAFWAFKRGAAGRPTLPAAALLLAVLADPARRAALAARLGAPPAAAAAPLADQVEALRSWARAGQDGGDAADPLLAAGLSLLAGPSGRLLAPYGPAGTIPRVSYADVAAGDPAALALLRDRILFVGAADLAERTPTDAFPIAYSRADGVEPSGVELAATACLNLLAGHSPRRLPAPAGAALLAGTTLAATTATLLLPAVLGLAAALALGAALTGLGVLLLSGPLLVLPAASLLLLALPAGCFCGLVARSRGVQRELERAVAFLTRGRVRRVDPLRPLALAERRRRCWAVCLATDMTDYVGLTETMRPRDADLARLFADYRGLLHEVVERHGGTVLDFTGDSSMCIWAAPAPSAALCRAAIAAGRALVRDLDGFAHGHGLLHHPTRIGLAEGEIVLGNLGQDGRFAYGALGDPLNVAARLERLNKELGSRILATAEVAAALGDDRTRPLGPMALRGRAGPVAVVVVEPMPQGAPSH